MFDYGVEIYGIPINRKKADEKEEQHRQDQQKMLEENKPCIDATIETFFCCTDFKNNRKCSSTVLGVEGASSISMCIAASSISSSAVYVFSILTGIHLGLQGTRALYQTKCGTTCCSNNESEASATNPTAGASVITEQPSATVQQPSAYCINTTASSRTIY